MVRMYHNPLARSGESKPETSQVVENLFGKLLIKKKRWVGGKEPDAESKITSSVYKVLPIP